MGLVNIIEQVEKLEQEFVKLRETLRTLKATPEYQESIAIVKIENLIQALSSELNEVQKKIVSTEAFIEKYSALKAQNKLANDDLITHHETIRVGLLLSQNALLHELDQARKQREARLNTIAKNEMRDARDSLIVTEFLNGASVKNLAQTYTLSPSGVRRILSKLAIGLTWRYVNGKELPTPFSYETAKSFVGKVRPGLLKKW